MKRLLLFVLLLISGEARAAYDGIQTLNLSPNVSRQTSFTGNTTGFPFLMVTNYGNSDVYIKLGTGVITASGSDQLVSLGVCAVFPIGGASAIAAIAPNDNTSLRIIQSDTDPVQCTNPRGMFSNGSNAILPDALRGLTGGIVTLTAGNIAPLIFGAGTPQAIFGNYAPGLVEIAHGTNASPITTAGPVLRLSMDSALLKTSCANNAADTGCSSALVVTTSGQTATTMVTSAALFGATGSSTTSGADVQAVNASGRVTGSGVGIGSGAYLEGFRSTATGKALGAEITAWNYTTTDCNISLTGIGECDGVWVPSRAKQATNYVATALHVGKADLNSAWLEGLAFNAGSVRDTTIDDASSSVIAYHLQGTHTTAFDVHDATLTNILLGPNSFSIAATGAITSSGDISLVGKTFSTSAGGTRPTLSDGTAYMLGSSTSGIVIGGRGSTNDFQIKNKNDVTVLAVGTGGTALSASSFIVTGAPFLGSGGTGGVGGSATLGGIYAGNGSTNDVTIQNKSAVSVMQVPTGTTTVTFAGDVFLSALNAVGTISGSLCSTTTGRIVYKVGANCF